MRWTGFLSPRWFKASSYLDCLTKHSAARYLHEGFLEVKSVLERTLWALM
jgi:hypothetical protein